MEEACYAVDAVDAVDASLNSSWFTFTYQNYDILQWRLILRYNSHLFFANEQTPYYNR